ncbi:PUA-like domain-containing protein [Gloeopeniophorella convolvens]|nr:PUA-like domain-containing protein [Gloeopeniophorella convolvens]
MPTEYELERLANIERNRKLLEGLKLRNEGSATGRAIATAQPKRAPKQRARAPSKKRVRLASDETDEGIPASKAARVDAPQTGLRRSSRNVGKVPNYATESQDRAPRLVVSKVGRDHDRDPNRPSGKRTHDPKTFGHIPGIPVGTWWETREDCSNDAIHAPWVAGISGSTEGAYSVALSGGYEDDVDLGDYFTFTGSGGRALRGTKANPKNLRTAPQSSDQSFEHSFNKALKISSETKKPVRVIRGYKLHSPYAPVEGYRYDGIYTVERAWMEGGLNPGGFLVCKFAFQRISGQPPLQETGKAEGDSELEDDAGAQDTADSETGDEESA